MKTILSIDGGGVKGIIPLHALIRLESYTGQPCKDLFSMIAGTSTGSVIAAGLSLGISARGLLAMYRNLAEQAFQRLPVWRIALNLGNHRYANDFIEATLDELGADRPLNSLPNDIMITGKNTRTGRTNFFVRDNPYNSQLWGTLSLKDAVLASIAAPTYFPAHSARVLGKDYTWVDGGVSVSGNPCYQAAVEALHYSGGAYPPGETRLLAFGTGRSPHAINPKRATALDWASWTLAQLLDDASEWQTYVTGQEYGETGRVDFRRYQLDLAPDIMEVLEVEVPPGTDVSRIRLDSVWAVELLDRIGRAFASAIDFDDPDGLVLRTSAGW